MSWCPEPGCNVGEPANEEAKAVADARVYSPRKVPLTVRQAGWRGW